MNFLLHRHFAQTETGSAASGLGAMLPDLWRMAHRRARPSPSAAYGAADVATADLLRGVGHHLEADAWFHRSEVFVLGERRLRQAMVAAQASPCRLGLFAHPLWELCLDGALLRREGLAPTKTLLGGALARTGPASRQRAASAAVLGRLTLAEADRARFDDAIERMFAALVEGPWLDSYLSGEGLAARADNFLVRVGLAPLEADARRRLAGSLAEASSDADLALVRLTEARRAKR